MPSRGAPPHNAPVTPVDGQFGTEVVLISACLLGLHTRHDGDHCRREEAAALAGQACLVPVCPEQLGGLSTPRVPVEIASGCGEDVIDGRARVVTVRGDDVTELFVRGARCVAELARICGATRAVLKEGSPSCGVTFHA